VNFEIENRGQIKAKRQ